MILHKITEISFSGFTGIKIKIPFFLELYIARANRLNLDYPHTVKLTNAYIGSLIL